MKDFSCFKAYDIRGELGVNIDEDICYDIGRAFAKSLSAKKVVVGFDARETSPALCDAVSRGLMDEGVEVLTLGLSGTEEMYFATTHFGCDGGIEVTASHNPINYNGMKMVKAGSKPLDPETELAHVRSLAEAGDFGPALSGGTTRDVAAEAKATYVEKVLSFVDINSLRPMTVVINSGNGAAGPTFDAIAAELDCRGAPITFVRKHHTPDSSFPNGIPNPLLSENQPQTRDEVIAQSAHLGVAFDGDFDRCFFFDETGAFVDGEYIVGLLADVFLEKEKGAAIVHDPRIIWNTQDIVAQKSGTAVQSKTGHAFIKAVMRDHNAIYGGEMSAHHYFRDFVFCDSGMIPWLVVCELMGRTGKPMSKLVAERIAAFPSSGEVNFRLTDPKATIAKIVDTYAPKATHRDDTDGISLSFGDWRFNLRSSNTEPVVRLNIEARGNRNLVQQKLTELRDLINGS